GMHKLIFYSLLKEGVYIWEGRNCFLSTAHTGQDIAYFISKVKKCCSELSAAGILHGKKEMKPWKGSHLIQSAIEIDAVLNKSSLDFACRYLFNSITKLRSVSCAVRFSPLIENNEEFAVTGKPEDHGLILSVYQNTKKTVIHFSADRDICDGWSVILFFKALAKCYKSLQNRQTLPDINFPAGESISKNLSDIKQQTLKRSLPAKTIHSTIPMDSIPSQMIPKLFAYMLYSFYRALQENDPMDETVISIPMAGQLLTHNLKVFDNCTIYFPCKFGEIPSDRDKADIEQFVDQVELQLKKGKHSFSNLYVNQDHADVVFNMDTLDFELAFDNESTRLLVVEEKVTGYKLVCNVSKLKDSLLITLKYATGSVTDHVANDLLHRFLRNMQKAKKHEHR
ncbi:MAG TPA: hypothetical protein VIZ28_04730, partial [Chitinophagaceae bacterium]